MMQSQNTLAAQLPQSAAAAPPPTTVNVNNSQYNGVSVTNGVAQQSIVNSNDNSPVNNSAAVLKGPQSPMHRPTVPATMPPRPPVYRPPSHADTNGTAPTTSSNTMPFSSSGLNYRPPFVANSGSAQFNPTNTGPLTAPPFSAISTFNSTLPYNNTTTNTSVPSMLPNSTQPKTSQFNSHSSSSSPVQFNCNLSQKSLPSLTTSSSSTVPPTSKLAWNSAASGTAQPRISPITTSMPQISNLNLGTGKTVPQATPSFQQPFQSQPQMQGPKSQYSHPSVGPPPLIRPSLVAPPTSIIPPTLGTNSTVHPSSGPPSTGGPPSFGPSTVGPPPLRPSVVGAPPLRPTTVGPPSLGPASNVRPSTFVPSPLGLRPSVAPPPLGPTSSIAPPPLGPPSSIAPPPLGPTPSIAPPPSGPPSSIAPPPSGPPSSIAPPPLGPPSSIAPPLVPPSSIAPPPLVPPSSIAPPPLGPPSSIAPPPLGPASSIAPPPLVPPSSIAPPPLGPPSSIAPPPLGPPSSIAPPPLGPTSSIAPPPLGPPPSIAPTPLGPPSSIAGPPLGPPSFVGPTSFVRPPVAPPPTVAPSASLSQPLSRPPMGGSSTSQPPPATFQRPPITSYPTIASSVAPQTSTNQQQMQRQYQQSPAAAVYQSNVTRDGWNVGWGTDSVDLLQQRQVLPPGGVEPPKPVLAQDFVRNCIPDILRCTFTKVPETKSLLQKAKMPFGILIHPFKDLEQLPVVSCQQIVRCRSCRTYINPFVVFRGERRWECNLCYRINELPDEFQYDPVSQTYGDPSRRPEVREATIEYIAPSEYMLRPPQPAVYLWLLDTSRQAVDTGYLQIVCDVLREQLDNIPGDRRSLFGFMTFSATVQFYLMPEESDSVNMLEVGDLEDIFVPHPDDLLVNISEQRDQIEKLLKTLPQTHANTTHTQSALGPALTAAYRLLYSLGGRLTVLTSILPSIGPGILKAREDPNQRAATDVLHLNPATDFYKKLALDCSGQQIAVDLFTLNSQYIDLATLSGISKFSGGCVHHFPNFHVHLNPSSVSPFVSCLTRYITRKIGFEAVMRIRATRGLTITNFHGHFFVRSPDLLSLPNINPDAGFAMQVGIEEPLHNIRTAAFQAALLYTSSRGERRIRVHTLCLPVTGNLHDVVNTVDQQAAVALLARMAVDRCQNSTSTDARDALVNACIDALTSYRNSLTQSPGRALMAGHNLKLWPMYTLALLKSISFRGGLSTKLDDRVFAMCELKTLPTRALIASIYPDLYPVHNLSESGALNIDDEVVPQPCRLQLSAEYLNRDGAYLADTGSKMIMYVRSSISTQWLNDVLDVEHFAAMPQMIHELPELDNNTSVLLNSFIKHLNNNRPYQSPILILREDSPARLQFARLLVEDRTEGAKSYVEFVQFLSSNVK